MVRRLSPRASVGWIVDRRLELYYGLPIAWAGILVSVLLNGSTGVGAVVQLVLGGVGVVEGAGLVTNWRGRTDAACARYKSDPSSLAARLVYDSTFRYAFGLSSLGLGLILMFGASHALVP